MKNKKTLFIALGVMALVVVAGAVYYSQGDLFQGRLGFRTFQPTVQKVEQSTNLQQVSSTFTTTNIDKTAFDTTNNAHELTTPDLGDVPSIPADSTGALTIVGDNNRLMLDGNAVPADDLTDTTIPLSEKPPGADLNTIVTTPTILELSADPLPYSLSGGMLVFRYRLDGFSLDDGIIYANIQSPNGEFIYNFQSKKEAGNGSFTYAWDGRKGEYDGTTNIKVAPGTYVFQIYGEAEGESIPVKKLEFQVTE